MSDQIKTLFVDNPDLVEQIEAFCAKNPEYLKRKHEFFEMAHEIAEIASYDLYDRFETRFVRYLASSNDLYYLFGLGLRQEVLSALQPEIP